jgi:hypothetical protein
MSLEVPAPGTGLQLGSPLLRAIYVLSIEHGIGAVCGQASGACEAAHTSQLASR